MTGQLIVTMRKGSSPFSIPETITIEMKDCSEEERERALALAEIAVKNHWVVEKEYEDSSESDKEPECESEEG